MTMGGRLKSFRLLRKWRSVPCGIDGSYSSNRDFVKLLTGLARVSKLELVMPLRQDNAFEGLSCTFANLKDLKLRTDFCTLSNILSTLCLLKNAPNLEKLFFESLKWVLTV
ncbi:unnamed protein product [Urochloa humidicola]